MKLPGKDKVDEVAAQARNKVHDERKAAKAVAAQVPASAATFKVAKPPLATSSSPVLLNAAAAWTQSPSGEWSETSLFGTAVAHSPRHKPLREPLKAIHGGAGVYGGADTFAKTARIEACQGRGAFLLRSNMLSPEGGAALDEGWFAVNGITRSKATAEQRKSSLAPVKAADKVHPMSQVVSFPSAATKSKMGFSAFANAPCRASIFCAADRTKRRATRDFVPAKTGTEY